MSIAYIWLSQWSIADDDTLLACRNRTRSSAWKRSYRIRALGTGSSRWFFLVKKWTNNPETHLFLVVNHENHIFFGSKSWKSHFFPEFPLLTKAFKPSAFDELVIRKMGASGNLTVTHLATGQYFLRLGITLVSNCSGMVSTWNHYRSQEFDQQTSTCP